MLESIVERRIVDEAKRRGGRAFKFVSPGCDGVPDRLILFPGGKIAFIEVKAPGKKLRPLQMKRVKDFVELGQKVYIVDNTDVIGGVLDEIQST